MSEPKKPTLSTRQIYFMKLLMRSNDVGGGWRNVSDALAPLVRDMAIACPDLFEIQEVEKLQVRLSDRARVLIDYV